MTGDTMRDKTRDRTREDDAMVEVGNYPTTLDGAVDRARLNAAGIEAVLFDTEMATNWVYTNAIGGVRLMVAHGDREAARAVLAADATPGDVEAAAAAAEEYGEAGPLDDPETWCPNCHSRDIRVLDEAPRGLISRWFNPGAARTCRSCGHRWRA